MDGGFSDQYITRSFWKIGNARFAERRAEQTVAARAPLSQTAECIAFREFPGEREGRGLRTPCMNTFCHKKKGTIVSFKK